MFQRRNINIGIQRNPAKYVINEANFILRENNRQICKLSYATACGLSLYALTTAFKPEATDTADCSMMIAMILAFTAVVVSLGGINTRLAKFKNQLRLAVVPPESVASQELCEFVFKMVCDFEADEEHYSLDTFLMKVTRIINNDMVDEGQNIHDLQR